MLTHLIVVADEGAIPFCYYDNPQYGDESSKLIEVEILSQAVTFAQNNHLAINVLYGLRPLTQAHEELIEQVPHSRIVPWSLHSRFPDAALVVNTSDLVSDRCLEGTNERNVILRIGREDVARLTELVRRLGNVYSRLTLVALDLDEFSEIDLERYASSVRMLGDEVTARYLSGSAKEFNVISDRLMLSAMRNCNPGIEHLTLGTDGRFYVCPAFYQLRDQEYVGGGIAEGPRFANQRLLDIANAPICHSCDAYHCRRCVYLNRRATLEVNTPSRQQCVAAHVEREVSREVRDALVQADQAFRVFSPISRLNYSDPMDQVNSEHGVRRHVTFPNQPLATGAVVTDERLSNRDLLLEILHKQNEILALLNRKDLLQ